MKRLSFPLCLLLMLLCVGCDGNRPEKAEFVVLFSNSMYGNSLSLGMEDEELVSLANFMTLVEEKRGFYGDHCIVLDGGDKFGRGYEAFYYNYVDRESMPLCKRTDRIIGFDAMAVGSQDILTEEVLHPYRWNPEHHPKLVCANLVTIDGGACRYNPYVILNRDGIRIAVLALVSPQSLEWNPSDEYETLDMIESAQYWMDEIQTKHHPDFVIGIFNSGVHYEDGELNIDTYKHPDGGIPAVIRVPGFDLALLYSAGDDEAFDVVNDAGQRVQVLKIGYESTQEVGLARIHMFRQGGKYTSRIFCTPISLDQFPASDDYVNRFRGARDSIMHWLDAPLCYLADTLRWRDAYFGPDAYRRFINEVQLKSSGADISLATTPVDAPPVFLPGVLSMRRIFQLYPYENELEVISLKGSELKRLLEWGIEMQFETIGHNKDREEHLLAYRHDRSRYYRFNDDGVPYLNYDPAGYISAAGIRYSVDLRRFADDRVTIHSMEDGTPFSMSKTYDVAVNSYLAMNGWNYISRGLHWDNRMLTMRIQSRPRESIRELIHKYIVSLSVDTLRLDRRPANWDILPVDYWQRQVCSLVDAPLPIYDKNL